MSIIRILRKTMLGAVVLCSIVSGAALAADPGITVSGVGTVKAKFTSAEMTTNVSANAELTADALVKFRDAKAKSIAALEALKMPNLKIDPQGMSMNVAVDAQQQQRMMNGMGGTPSKPKIEVSEQLKISIKEADKVQPQELLDQVLKVIDTLRDAGLAVGPPQPTNYYQMQMQAQSGKGNSVVLFTVEDPESVREQAYQAAVENAKKKATRLANLAGVKLGAVTSIAEGTGKEQETSIAMVRAMYYGGMTGTTDDNAVNTTILSEIPVKMTVTVQFAIEK